MKQAGMQIVAISTAVLGLFSGCNPVEPATETSPGVEAPKVEKTMVVEGDSYADVYEKLGKPNIDSSTQTSRVLIYDEIEIKLQDDAVVAVYDHRKNGH